MKGLIRTPPPIAKGLGRGLQSQDVPLGEFGSHRAWMVEEIMEHHAPDPPLPVRDLPVRVPVSFFVAVALEPPLGACNGYKTSMATY